MSTTLTNGLKLPDKGSVDWYADMQSNYAILDGAVGTIAEHTSALSGKAPLVHTHTKSDITDFPAYGNAAGTICEGNDSRLSDARTPVAHTHGKADITDLLNSANVWTGSNVYSGDSLPTLKFKNTSLDISSLPASNLGIHIDYLDKNNVVVGGWNYIKGPSGITRLYCELATKNSNNQEIRRTLRLDTDQNGDNWSFYPSADINLGISTNKWKTLNGINPGALSLPDLNTAQSIDRTGWVYDGSTYNPIKLSSTDTNMTKNGWLYVRISSTGSSDKLSIKYNSIGDKYPTSSFGDTGGCIEVFVPVIAGSSVYLCATKDLQFCKFYPCLGNVPSGV